jgi:hypothetical protein
VEAGFVLNGFVEAGFVLNGFVEAGFVLNGFVEAGFVLSGSSITKHLPRQCGNVYNEAHASIREYV